MEWERLTGQFVGIGVIPPLLGDLPELFKAKGVGLSKRPIMDPEKQDLRYKDPGYLTPTSVNSSTAETSKA